ncbi:DUF4336 domain-containing protein [Shewanella woodyi]|uniref:DUF4336 domain-containing protein n=1 Tax=Shewanella woodyi TaxID=60961 RepID=UPI0037491F86
MSLVQLGENIWAHEDSMPLGGIQLRLRMTIVKLSCGGLWIHSPTKPAPELQAEIDELGKVTFIVGAANGHNTWLSAWQTAYPEAELYVSGGIPKKVKLDNYMVLEKHFENIWCDDFEREFMPNVELFNESVFFHKPSRSLIVTDLIQNHSDEIPSGFAGVMTRCVFRPLGFKGACVAPPLKLGFTIKDKLAFSVFIKNIQQWDFDKIIVTHGDVITDDAKGVFAGLVERFIR